MPGTARGLNHVEGAFYPPLENRSRPTPRSHPTIGCSSTDDRSLFYGRLFNSYAVARVKIIASAWCKTSRQILEVRNHGRDDLFSVSGWQVLIKMGPNCKINCARTDGNVEGPPRPHMGRILLQIWFLEVYFCLPTRKGVMKNNFFPEAKKIIPEAIRCVSSSSFHRWFRNFNRTSGRLGN